MPEAAVFEGFRPPYADEDMRTGFSGIVIKKLGGNQGLEAPEGWPWDAEETLEPTESDIGVSADLDEGVVYGGGRPARKREEQAKTY